VLSRYTLSLLTTQQFQRAATTICALEYLRLKEAPVIPGGPFSIGLWVGGGTTPNRYAEAHDKFQQERAAARPKDVFILDRCPWCGTQVMPTAKSPDIGDYGVRTTETSFRFLCPREECYFHERLPVAVVDEHLYADPRRSSSAPWISSPAWPGSLTRDGCSVAGAGKRPASTFPHPW
jgi:hypothetical protein